MKKNFTYVLFASLAMVASVSVVGCQTSGGSSTPERKFSFTIGLASGRRGTLYMPDSSPDYEMDYIKVNPHNEKEGVAYEYTYTVPTASKPYVDVVEDETTGRQYLNPKQKTPSGFKAAVKVREKVSKISRNLTFVIKDPLITKDGGANYVTAPATDRAQILADLEKYAMQSHLTGITLFENGGYVRYSDRVHLPVDEYVPGFGFGLLSDGWLTKTNSNVVNPSYLQSATSSDPGSINAWDATGSQVSDLNGYITSSYFGARLDGTGGYEWYPILAKDTVDGKPFLRPKAIYKTPNKLNMYKKWRIYVKTGAEEGVKYRVAQTYLDKNNVVQNVDPVVAAFDKTEIKIEDYEFIYQMLLSERSQVVRGTELANDTTYGIKGAKEFYRLTKDMTDNDQLDLQWRIATRGYNPEDGQDHPEKATLGIQTGSDENGSFIDIELINAIDEFTAMYTLSSNLYCPVPKAFIKHLGGGDYTKGAREFGTWGDGHIMNKVISVGPYFLENWVDLQVINFARNETWFECDDNGFTETGDMEPIDASKKYHIQGVRMRIIRSDDPDAIYKEFIKKDEASGNPLYPLDSAGITKNYIADKDEPGVKKTVGDSTFKLNVNSCTQDYWNDLFGDSGKIAKVGDDAYLCKPWMANSNFLDGIYWSIDRQKFAEDRGVNPSFQYFADTYLIDPENGVSYNATDQHLEAVSDFHNVDDEDNDDYGHNEANSIRYFKLAIQELAANGDITYGSDTSKNKVDIHIRWMYTSDIKDYGDDIARNIKGCFDAAAEDLGANLYLEINQEAVTNWTDVYYEYLMKGKFDLGFGAISGNSYNPLNFLEVLKSDNSSGFTLNFGTDTSKVDDINTIFYDNKAWSFDALWAAADHGTIVNKGEETKPVKHCYLSDFSTNELYEGGSLRINYEFVEKEGVEINLLEDKVLLQIPSYGPIALPIKNIGTYKEDGYLLIEFEGGEGEFADMINTKIRVNNDLVEKAKKETDPLKKEEYEHPFKRQYYGVWWEIEIWYTLSVAGGDPSENVEYALKNKDGVEPADKYGLARF